MCWYSMGYIITRGNIKMKEVENIFRVRKLIRKRIRFTLPKIKATPTVQSLEYAERESEAWFDSLRGKSAENITDSIFVESW